MIIKRTTPRTGIASVYKNNCLERGLSTMRLALGYSSGLPSSWVSQTANPRTIPALLPSFFPGREVRVWCPDKPNGCKYMGEYHATTKESDDWLTAFVYGCDGKDSTHFVIGEPASYDVIVVPLIIAVSIKKTIR